MYDELSVKIFFEHYPESKTIQIHSHKDAYGRPIVKNRPLETAGMNKRLHPSQI